MKHLFALSLAACCLAITSCSGPVQQTQEAPTTEPVVTAQEPAAATPAPEATASATPADPSPVPSTKPADEPTDSPYDIKPLEPGVDGDWLISRLAVEPAHMNPLHDTADAYVARITYARQDIFECLLERNNVTLDYEPSVAESFEISDDHLTYTFHIRKNVVFSDGTPLTANDVKFTIDTIRDPKNETADLRNYFNDVESITMPDDYTVVIKCKQPYFLHLATFGDMPILPKHIYGEGDFNNHPNMRNPIGSGPYLFDSWSTNQEIVLVRNENYWNKENLPHLKRYVYKIITDDSVAFQALLSKNLDLIPLTPEQWVNRTDEPEFLANFDKRSYYGASGYVGGLQYIGWNMRKPMFSDKRVRQALTMLLNRQEILDTIFYGLGKVVSGNAFSESIDYDKSIAPWPFDPAAANKLLDDAGWSTRNSEGIRTKDGAAFQFEFMFPPNSPEVEQMATVFQEELQRAGIKMTIRPIEWATFLEYITKREFDAVTLSWAIPPDSDPFQLWHSTQTEKGSNYPGFNNPEADKIIEDARLEFDKFKRAEMYHRLHAILHDEQPYTFLFSRKALAALDKRFRNVNVYPLGPTAREWFVPAELQRYK